jgi:hypothetical protein
VYIKRNITLKNIFIFGFTGKSNFFQDKANFLKHYFYQASTVVGTLFMTLGADFANDSTTTKKILEDTNTTISQDVLAIVSNNWFLLVIGLLFLLYGTIGNYIDNKKLAEDNKNIQSKDLKINSLNQQLSSTIEDNEQLMSKLQEKHQELVENWLKNLYNNLDLISYDRLTIYFVQNQDLTLLARYSSNPVIREIHNQRFPINTGVISLCWQHGNYKEIECPSFEEEQDKYYSYMKEKYNFTKQKIDSLTMKSHRFYGVSINEADNRLGVILYESNDKKEVENFNQICDKIGRYCSMYESYLSKFIQDAIRLDRLSQIRFDNKSVDDDLITELGDLRT